MVESPLHLSLKHAVRTNLSGGNHCWFENTMGPWGGSGSLRVDVSYTRKHRHYYVECETQPNIKRLIEKGKRRNRVRSRTNYILVVKAEWINRLDWGQLRGYFDKIYGYNPDEERFTYVRDLRLLGSLRDCFLDIVVPIYMDKKFQSLRFKLTIRKNRLKHSARTLIQCTACKLDIETPWIFCPKMNCPESQPR